MSADLSVLMFVPHYPFPVVGGLEKQSRELSIALSNAGLNVIVLSFLFEKNQKKIECESGVLIYRITWINNRILRAIILPILLTYTLFILRNKFDVLHLHQHSPISLFAIVVSKLLNKKTFTTVR